MYQYNRVKSHKLVIINNMIISYIISNGWHSGAIMCPLLNSFVSYTVARSTFLDKIFSHVGDMK